MENLPDNVPLYELDMVKDMISAVLGRAPGQMMMGSFITPHIFYGMTALNQITGYLSSRLEKGERRILVITDDFTEKFAGQVIDVLNSIEAESKVWSGVKPEGPLPTIEEAVKVCEEYKPTVFVAIGGGSVMDSAKAIMIKYEKPETDLFKMLGLGELGLRKKVKYLIAIPTTSGTGSEVTSIAVLTNMDKNPPQKLTIAHSE